MSEPRLKDGEPCGCGECIAAGVADVPVRKTPQDGLIHGYKLAAFKRAEQAFKEKFQSWMRSKGMR